MHTAADKSMGQKGWQNVITGWGRIMDGQITVREVGIGITIVSAVLTPFLGLILVAIFHLDL